jgi:uncharacterized protein YegP (UPF0339 family)
MSVRAWSVALVVLVAGGPPVSAQGGKMKFEIYQDAAKEYRWRLKASNGQIMATGGQGYKAKADCRQAVQHIKSDVDSDKLKFEVYEDKAKEYRWRLKASNGQTVAAAPDGYKTKASCERATESIKKGAGKAEVEEKE